MEEEELKSLQATPWYKYLEFWLIALGMILGILGFLWH